ncbi:MAG: DUF882 domain-containing protein [Gammaproteobacteria bacterium]|nr:DUF882 domain-containing protein [Gammaproteobacteria bacterium]
MDLGRRTLLKGLLLAPLGLTLPVTGSAGNERRLAFYHTHTGESLSLVYHDGQDYLSDSLESIDNYLRDFRTGEIQSIDRKLLDQLFAVKQLTGSRGVFEVISGYRSPKTNAALRGKSGGVAKKSLHMQGRAIDVRLTDVPSTSIRKVALALQSGGVGYYHKSDFVHLDTGPFRTW